MTQANDDVGKFTFEQAMAELEELVSKMAAGKVPLAELISGYERGNKLAAHCRRLLDSLEKRIEILASDDGGKGQWQEFDPDAAPSRHPDAPRKAAERQPASAGDDLPF